MTDLYSCMRCEWFGREPAEATTWESSEFWGQRESRAVVLLRCPDCNDDVEETLACMECSERPIDDADGDFCTDCAKATGHDLRATLVDIAGGL